MARYHVLNQHLDFASVGADVRRAFLHGQATKRLLTPGTQLYKYTQHGLYRPDGGVTPWWSSVKPLEAGDPGLAVSNQRAAALGATPGDFARARAAVTYEWNPTMDDCLMARLVQPVYGFSGRCAHQRVREGDAKVFFIGGAYQLWIPGLTRAHVVPA